jgi:hypothetical protein
MSSTSTSNTGPPADASVSEGVRLLCLLSKRLAELETQNSLRRKPVDTARLMQQTISSMSLTEQELLCLWVTLEHALRAVRTASYYSAEARTHTR